MENPKIIQKPIKIKNSTKYFEEIRQIMQGKNDEGHTSFGGVRNE